MADRQGGPGRPGGSLESLRRDVSNYFIRVEEADEQAKLTKQAPAYPPAPKLLVLFNRLRAWKVLPLSGGYFDQPYLLMQALDIVRVAIEERREIEQINLRLQQEEAPAIGDREPVASLPQSKG